MAATAADVTGVTVMALTEAASAVTVTRRKGEVYREIQAYEIEGGLLRQRAKRTERVLSLP